MRRSLFVLLGLALVFATGGCSVVGGSSGYAMTVYFTKTPSLYVKSRVKVMGADAGDVERMRVEGRTVRVDLRINSNVPVPADARATIAAETAIGERSVILSPAWRPGMRRAAPGTVIPVTRTDPPVEIDDVLGSFTNLADSLDPTKVKGLVHTGAELLNDRGQGINNALSTTASLSNDLAAQDKQIASAATSLRDLVTLLNQHDAGLRSLIDAFSTTSSQLANERTRLKDLLVGLSTLIQKGAVIITSYRETLPKMLSQASTLVMTLKADSASMVQAMSGLAGFTDMIVNAWDPKTHTIVARIQLTATLRIWLQPIFDRMGWGKVPCLDQTTTCKTTIVKKANR